MNGIDLLKPVIDAANRNNAQSDGDYLDDEGLLCCGKCHTRKQLVVHLPEGLRRTETENTMTVGVVWFEKNSSTYRRYLPEAVDEFEDNVGFFLTGGEGE